MHMCCTVMHIGYVSTLDRVGHVNELGAVPAGLGREDWNGSSCTRIEDWLSSY